MEEKGKEKVGFFISGEFDMEVDIIFGMSFFIKVFFGLIFGTRNEEFSDLMS